MNTKEKILQDALEELKQKAGDVLEDIMSRLYTDYLPYVETDTECNIATPSTIKTHTNQKVLVV